MKTHYTQIAYWSWLVLLLVWLPGYFTRKSTSTVTNSALQALISALLIMCFIFLFNPTLFGLEIPITPQTALLGVIGLTLDLIGVASAIWARWGLGRNWSGAVMAVHADHELVQRGPYAIVRHPIYSGLLLALAGTALTLGTLASYLGLASGLVAFLARVNLEEKALDEHFGEKHRTYRQRTRKLIPFLW
jgi:protein-S-isoprenylcysteine O-methyltransferase